jgi:hypothetical protein
MAGLAGLLCSITVAATGHHGRQGKKMEQISWPSRCTRVPRFKVHRTLPNAPHLIASRSWIFCLEKPRFALRTHKNQDRINRSITCPSGKRGATGFLNPNTFMSSISPHWYFPIRQCFPHTGSIKKQIIYKPRPYIDQNYGKVFQKILTSMLNKFTLECGNTNLFSGIGY